MGKALVGIEYAREIENVKNQMPLHLQAQAVKAELYYKYFKELMNQGFTDTQALEIIKSRGLE